MWQDSQTIHRVCRLYLCGTAGVPQATSPDLTPPSDEPPPKRRAALPPEPRATKRVRWADGWRPPEQRELLSDQSTPPRYSSAARRVRQAKNGCAPSPAPVTQIGNRTRAYWDSSETADPHRARLRPPSGGGAGGYHYGFFRFRTKGMYGGV